ncbi:MAG: PaaI family thioesterase [Leptospiraceae bacterium]|nr:PaaI family thioesterase [Leptospiraceae bacterium]
MITFSYSSFIRSVHQGREESLKAFFDEDKKKFYFEFSPGKEMEGPPNHVHGGYLASILDEAMGAVMFLSGYVGLTHHFEILYKKPVSLYQTHYIVSWIEKVERRKIFIEANVFSKDVIYTKAKGIFFQFDFHKLGLDNYYQKIIRYQEIRKQGYSVSETLEILKKEFKN